MENKDLASVGQEILRACRNELYLNMPYLDEALCALAFVPGDEVTVSAVDLAGWTGGTFLGAAAGSVLPPRVLSALGVALYGMFIAIIIPPSKHDRAVGLSVLASFLLSWLCSVLPMVREMSAGPRTIVLTILIAALAAYVKPVKIEDHDEA